MKVTDLAAKGPAVVGVFEGDIEAEAAVRRLRAQGVEAGAIGVTRRAPTPPPPDTPAMSKVFWTGFWWSVVGLAAGMAIGLLLGTLGIGIPGTTASIWLQVASWGMFLHVAGAIVGCYLALDTGDRFSSKAAHHDQPATMVRVIVASELEALRLEGVLKDAGACETQRHSGPAPAGL